MLVKSSAIQIPVYSLHNFSAPERANRQFQIEVFDANRHFEVHYPHRHDFFEVLFLQKGSGYHVIDNNKYEIKPPCVFFMSPGQAHKIELSSDIDGFIYIFTAEFYLLHHINRNRLLEFPFFFTIQHTNPPLVFSDEANRLFLASLFEKGVTEVAKGEEASVDLIRSLLDLILVYCASLYPQSEGQHNKGKGHLLVKRFYQLVEENYQKNLSVSDYAEMLNITSNHLTQVVKDCAGKTTNIILQEKQLLEIKRLLVYTQLGVSEIAHQLNFADQSYFTKFFKRATGLTPLRFRNESMKST